MYGWGGGLLSGQNMQNNNRNWGSNADRNRWIANVTGYSGDFGGGQFVQWGQQKGLDANTLVNIYDRMGQQQPQQPQMPQQGGWGNMPALQGLLSGYQPIGAYGGYGGASFGAPVNPTFSNQPGFAGTFPPANSGSNMLWTV